ncbi:MAG: hypothetical protein ACTSPJ_08570 [Candidatus Heimdallarchaeaceae archaeon]
MIFPFIIYLLAFVLPALISLAIFPIFIRKMLSIGKYGIDIHKKEQPKVAEMGGIVTLSAIIISSVILILLIQDQSIKLEIMVFTITLTIAGIIGIVDDIRPLGAITKPILLLFAALPIIISGYFTPQPVLPFVGKTRLTIVYYLLLPFVISVTSNAVNMIDVYNGSMASTTIIILICIFISNGIINGFQFTTLSTTNIYILIMIAAAFSFWIFNRYPAKVFAGDTGSLIFGASLGAIAVLGKLEIVVIIAMIPLIMNSFGIISSVKGLKERREIKVRPTSMTEDWKLQATRDSQAPITLAGLVLQKGPLREDDVVKAFNILVIISGFLSIITAILIWVTETFLVN